MALEPNNDKPELKIAENLTKEPIEDVQNIPETKQNMERKIENQNIVPENIKEEKKMDGKSDLAKEVKEESKINEVKERNVEEMKLETPQKINKETGFPEEFDKQLDLTKVIPKKVELSYIKPWMHKRIYELYNFEEEVLEYIIDSIIGKGSENNEELCPKKMFIKLNSKIMRSFEKICHYICNRTLEYSIISTGI